MKYIKSIISISLSIITVFTCALLPRIVGAVRDRTETGVVSYAPVREISLNMAEPSLRRSLATLASYDMNLIVDDTLGLFVSDMHLTEETVLDAALAGLEPYISAGLIRNDIDFLEGNYNYSAEIYHSYATRTSTVFWNIFMGGNNWSLTMMLDDQTGAVVSMRYEDYDYPYENYEAPLDSRSDDTSSGGSGEPRSLTALTEAYFDGLGEEFADENLFDSFEKEYFEGETQSGYYGEAYWHTGLEEYGIELGLAFHTVKGGFSVYVDYIDSPAENVYAVPPEGWD